MTTPTESTDREIVLLRRWNDGDQAARDELLLLVQPWLQSKVHAAMRKRSHAVMETLDVVQDVIRRFLAYGPKFTPANSGQLRKLFERIASNALTDAGRRKSNTEAHIEDLMPTSASMSGFGPAVPTFDRPAAVAERNEARNWVRLALQFLAPDDRYLLLASEVDGLPWATIAKELGLASPDAARVRAARLKPTVANLLRKLQAQQVPEAPNNETTTEAEWRG